MSSASSSVTLKATSARTTALHFCKPSRVERTRKSPILKFFALLLVASLQPPAAVLAASSKVVTTSTVNQAGPAQESTVAAASKPPQYISDQLCKACHYKETKAFTATMMGNVFELHPRDTQERLGCQGCHGPGSVHLATGGKKTTGMLTFRPSSNESVQADNDRCLSCHERGEHVFWRASTHGSRGLACTDCHTIMRKESPQFQLTSAPLVTPFINPFVVTRPETQVCLRCHLREKMEINLPSHMPLREGSMVCTDCHNPHGGPYPRQLRAATVNELCFTCHAEKRGPFLWIHPPVMMNCLNCHLPHGSVIQHMLVIRQPLLCQRCHVGTFHPGTPGQPMGVFVFNQSCDNCHSQIHGSNSPGGRVFTR
jgi:DmsE family decaheme c-type cytochrome